MIKFRISRFESLFYHFFPNTIEKYILHSLHYSFSYIDLYRSVTQLIHCNNFFSFKTFFFSCELIFVFDFGFGVIYFFLATLSVPFKSFVGKKSTCWFHLIGDTCRVSWFMLSDGPCKYWQNDTS